jgi:hypothetical protein
MLLDHFAGQSAARALAFSTVASCRNHWSARGKAPVQPRLRAWYTSNSSILSQAERGFLELHIPAKTLNSGLSFLASKNF